ncbi:hypothetical protein EDB92DRAFT_1876845 [Lactarius akahatsu]|uniref:Uncharacterized protein n=1 Tax=Lactarius akahatsu TaxID=416441 RepID=A0AAD4LCY7_9AGAM|nr:hypothetical protein EDB92DRAFT_1876845 [Lactarius akahatsu]
MTRWTLGASGIMFTNPAFSTFFRKGETFRGTSIYRPAIDTAIKSCAQARGCIRPGIFTFSSTFICCRARRYTSSQRGRYASLTYATDPQTGLARLRRFMWSMCVPPSLAPAPKSMTPTL